MLCTKEGEGSLVIGETPHSQRRRRPIEGLNADSVVTNLAKRGPRFEMGTGKMHPSSGGDRVIEREKVAGSGTKTVRLNPSSRDKEARMRAMTDAAVALFSEEGYSAVSTRRIADRAGCSETLLFRYFGDKHGLLMAVCNGLWDEGRPERTGASEFQTVQEYLEYFFLAELRDLKRVAPSLRVVIAALINDPDMSADFDQKHDAAAERVAKELRQFQDTGAISPDVDVNALANAIEQLGFAVGFFLQLIFERPEAELTAIAVSVAAALSQGLQANAAQPLLEPRRRKALAAVLGARESLDGIVELLGDAELTGGGSSRNGSPGSDRSRA